MHDIFNIIFTVESRIIGGVGIIGPGRFPGIAGNHGNDGKSHKSHQIPSQTQRNINKLCFGKISRKKAVRIKFSVDSAFSNMLYGKKRKPGNAGNQQKAF